MTTATKQAGRRRISNSEWLEQMQAKQRREVQRTAWIGPSTDRTVVITPVQTRAGLVLDALLSMARFASKTQAADVIGVSSRTVHAWLSGQRVPSTRGVVGLIEAARWSRECGVPWYAIRSCDREYRSVVLEQATNRSIFMPPTWAETPREVLLWLTGGGGAMHEARCAELVDRAGGRTNPIAKGNLSAEARVRMALLAVWKLRGYPVEDLDWVGWSACEVGWADAIPSRKPDLWRGGRLPPNPFDLRDLSGWIRTPEPVAVHKSGYGRRGRR